MYNQQVALPLESDKHAHTHLSDVATIWMLKGNHMLSSNPACLPFDAKGN